MAEGTAQAIAHEPSRRLSSGLWWQITLRIPPGVRLSCDEYHDTYPCECTLDTGRGQSEINAIWLQPGGPRVYNRTSRSERGGGGTSGGGSRNRAADIDFEDVAPQSDLFDPGPKLVHWTPSKRSLLDGPPDDSEPSEFAPQERGRLRPLLPFKNMELVWVKVPPIDAPNGGDPINLWPALVVDGWSGSHIGEHHYKIRLLGVETKHTVPETAVFPWQVKPLRRRSATSGPQTLPGNLTSPAQIQQFRPLTTSANPATDETSLPRTYANAVGPLKLAQTVALDVAAQFCLMGQHVGERQDPNAPRLYRWAWMGPQRIEPGDLVRLAPTREKLTQLGFPTMELLEESDGADKACLFVQVVHIKLNEEGEAGFVGHLFELVSGRGQVESPGPVPLPLPPQAHKFRLISDPTSPRFFNFFWVAGRYEHLTSNSDSHRNFIENNFLGKHPLNHWDVQYRRGKELPTPVKYILSMIGLGPGKWNAITSRAVTVTGRQSGIQHAVKEARRLYFGDEEEIWVSSSSEGE
ncbi:hypothetical protein FRC00_007093 [Tulasnella sp. 408]|nr:hypothetical protein FRC00_007093 [Tulasnella sp. 408]